MANVGEPVREIEVIPRRRMPPPEPSELRRSVSERPPGPPPGDARGRRSRHEPRSDVHRGRDRCVSLLPVRPD